MNWRTSIAEMLARPHSVEIEDERHFGVVGQHYRAAAVLIAITDQPEPTVILTQRPEWLRSHAGQVAFPGGKIDPDDRDEIAAALREAEEELAISPSDVHILGVGDTYFTGSGFKISPVVASIPADLPLIPNPNEVEDWFEVPLAFLLDPANARRKSGVWNGIDREYYEMDWQGRRIWGVTAGIIANLVRRMADD
jgi:8-oxo-dGTP pyrophosphatase MutT (NUDIX family)